MNRLKLWLYMVVVVVGGLANLWAVTRTVTARSIQHIDRTLLAAAAQLDARTQLKTREAVAVAQLAARDPDLVAAVSEPTDGARWKPLTRRSRGNEDPGADPDARRAALEKTARVAIEGAARTVAVDLSGGVGWAVAGREAIAGTFGDEPSKLDQGVAKYLGDLAAAKTRQGYARIGNSIWYVASASVGTEAAVAIAVQLDAVFAREIRRTTGADLTLAAGSTHLASTLAADDARAMLTARNASQRPVGLGELRPMQPAVHFPFKAPVLKLLFSHAPAYRAISVPIPDLPDASAVLSVPVAPALTLLATWQYFALVALGSLFVLGIALGLFARGRRDPGRASSRVRAGVGNSVEMAELRRRAPAFVSSLDHASTSLDGSADAVTAPPAPSPSEDTGTNGPVDRVFGAPAGPSPSTLAPPSPELFPLASPAALLQDAAQPLSPPAPPPIPAVAPAPAPLPAAPDPEDEHWRQVFDDFIIVRQQCGESSEGLTFEKFRAKLQKNRDALVQKYACRSVRFQVYVKEGKAALKATPLR